MVLLVLILYVASIIFKMQLAEMEVGGISISDDKPFGSIPMSMCWLFFAATLGDNILMFHQTIVKDGTPFAFFMAFLFWVMVFLCMFTILNMLIGILCEVV